MKLQPTLNDPALTTIWRLLEMEFDEAVAASGLGETFREALLRNLLDVSRDGAHDLIEAVGSTAPGTRDFVVCFGIGNGFRLALARTAQNLLGGRTH